MRIESVTFRDFSITLVLIKWVGTHEEYDAIDVMKIGLPASKEAVKKMRMKKKSK